MKNNDAYMLMALGVLIAYYITKPKAAAAPPGSTGPQQIQYGTPNGWQYFTNGTAIGPDGKYYMNGELVWAP